MPNPFIEQLKERARATPRRIVFPEGDDERVIEAARRLKEERLAEPVLIAKNAVLGIETDRSSEFAAAPRVRRPLLPPARFERHDRTRSRRHRSQAAAISRRCW